MAYKPAARLQALGRAATHNATRITSKGAPIVKQHRTLTATSYSMTAVSHSPNAGSSCRSHGQHSMPLHSAALGLKTLAWPNHRVLPWP